MDTSADEVMDIAREGHRAYERGDYDEARRLFRIAADQGNTWAQSWLGFMHEEGLGWRRAMPRPTAGTGELPTKAMLGRSANCGAALRSCESLASSTSLATALSKIPLRPAIFMSLPPAREIRSLRTPYASWGRSRDSRGSKLSRPASHLHTGHLETPCYAGCRQPHQSCWDMNILDRSAHDSTLAELACRFTACRHALAP